MRILFASQDPGGCNALLPVINELLHRKKDVLKIVGAKSSIKIYKREGIEFDDFTGLTDKEIETKIRDFNPDKIILGTSGGFSLEDKIFALARAYNYKTISIIDSWMHYADRYRGADKISNLALLVTDKVLVNDVYMAEQAISEGIPRDVIEITGNPHLINCLKKIKIIDKIDGVFTILFISQPFSELPELNNKYNEIEVFDDLLQCLRKIHFNRKIKILLRPHPRENVEKFKNINDKYKEFDIEIDNNDDLYASINNSDLIFGMNSMVLVECILAGKKVVSYQPKTSIQDDVLITNRLGISKLVIERKDLLKVLTDILSVNFNSNNFNKNIEAIRNELINKNAVENIIKVIYLK